MTYYSDTFATPFGLFSTAMTSAGQLVGTAFGDIDVLRSRIDAVELVADANPGRHVREEVLAYCAGQRSDFTITMAPTGTPFQQRVWSALKEIPVGSTRTYGELATRLGQPNASRAVGRANATNPICLLIPCHRVIGANGSLTGFAFGEEIKRQLLEHERKFTRSTKDSRAA